MNKLPFIDVLAGKEEHGRKSDLASFEYTYQAEITNVYSLTNTEKLYQIQIIDPKERQRFCFKPGQLIHKQFTDFFNRLGFGGEYLYQ